MVDEVFSVKPEIFNNKQKLLIAFFAVILIVLIISRPVEKMQEKVLVIGIDALDPKVIDKLMDEGKLPNFKKLNYSSLQTTIPPETPVAWSAVATGANPGKYGIFDFINREPETYLPKLNLAEEKPGLTKTEYVSARKGTAFWDITSDGKIPTTVIRWPVTFPPSKVNGKMLSGLGTIDIKGWSNSYRFYTTKSYDSDTTGAEKIIRIFKDGNTINTNLFGPFKRKNNELVEIQTPMKIAVGENSTTINVNDKDYEVKTGEWSQWMKAKFKVGFLNDVHGIFNVYIFSTEPFEMYVSSIQIDPEEPIYDITYPDDYSEELAKEIGLFYTLGMPEETKAVTDGRMSKEIFFEQIKQIEEERTKMFWQEFENFDSGLYAFGFDAGDRLQHIFWNDKVLEDDGFKIAKEIEEYYTNKDKFLGEVLEKLDNETKLIIFSDHGFNSFEREVNINRWLIDNGYMTLTQEVTEKDAGELFKYVDWEKTKAYSLGFTSFYINLKNREGKGIVDENEKERLVDEIIKKLSELKDPKTNQNVIVKLYKGDEVYSGDYQKDGPDIVIGFEQGYRMSWQNAVGGVAPEIFADVDDEWTGDHLMDRSRVPAVLFTNFEVKKANPDLIDIAPTILKFFGLKVPENMDGTPLN